MLGRECNNEGFRLRFCFRKDSVIDKDSSAAYTIAASSYCFETLIYSYKNFRSGYWRFIRCLQPFTRLQSYCEKKRTLISCHSLRTWVIQREVNNVAHFPEVFGTIECTGVRIICPNKENAMGPPQENLVFCVCTSQCNFK